jgi:hypothetical protein
MAITHWAITGSDIIEKAGGIDHIRDLASSIDLFSQDAYGGKQQWVKKALEDKRWNVSESDIKQMLQNLRGSVNLTTIPYHECHEPHSVRSHMQVQ